MQGKLHIEAPKTKISYMSCVPKHDISYTYPAEDRAKLNEMYRKSCLSYRFPTCMKSKFLSSAIASIILFIGSALTGTHRNELLSLIARDTASCVMRSNHIW